MAICIIHMNILNSCLPYVSDVCPSDCIAPQNHDCLYYYSHEHVKQLCPSDCITHTTG